MKLLNKSQFFLIIFALILCFTGCNISRKLTIGFYSTSESIAANTEEVIKNINLTDNVVVNFVQLNDETPLASQIKKNHVDAIITCAGTSVNKCLEQQKKNAGVSAEVLSPLFTTIRQSAVLQNDKAKTLPLLIDNLEIDIDTQSFANSGITGINTWNDIEAYCKTQQRKIEYPVIFTGKDAVFLLDLLGAIAEAKSGVDSYYEAVQLLNSPENTGTNFNAQQLTEKLLTDSNAPLVIAGHYLKKLSADGYINPGVREFSNYDIDIFAQDRRARVLFTTLSAHRTFYTKGISRFSTIYVPSENGPQTRRFTANVTYLVPIKNNPNLNALAEKLYSSDIQTDLSRKTGLAPVAARCRTPDKQADDVRYWISATNEPLAGLGHETSLTKEQLDILKTEILGNLF